MKNDTITYRFDIAKIPNTDEPKEIHLLDYGININGFHSLINQKVLELKNLQEKTMLRQFSLEQLNKIIETIKEVINEKKDYND